MVDVATGMVEIIRDFLVVHRSLTELVATHREGRLRFHALEQLVGNDASSVLFRFKEGCHAMFRTAAPAADLAGRTGVLFDLAVGSLFHEAMKLRENVYQHEVYRPRIEALRAASDPGSSELVDEFAKICAAAAERIDESVAEAEILLGQTKAQLLRLISEQRDQAMVARCLFQEAERVVEVYPEGLDAIFAEVYGEAIHGYVKAADACIASAHFNGALAALADAIARAPGRADIEHRIAYAEGMRAFRDRDYRRSVERLTAWLDGGIGAEETPRLQLALSAISHVESLYEDDGDDANGDAQAVIAAAQDLAAALSAALNAQGVAVAADARSAR